MVENMGCPIRDAFERLASYALDAWRSVRRGRKLDFKFEQARMTALLLEIDPHGPTTGPSLGARYAAACWLDELFICYSPWASAWNENKLESSLYGRNDRAWEFWRQAALAEAEADDLVLACYYDCAALGFRGALLDKPEELKHWMDRVRERVTRVPAVLDSSPYRGRTEGAPRRLLGERRLKRLSNAALIGGIAAIPIVTYVVATRLM